MGNAHCSYRTNTFQKGVSPSKSWFHHLLFIATLIGFNSLIRSLKRSCNLLLQAKEIDRDHQESTIDRVQDLGCIEMNRFSRILNRIFPVSCNGQQTYCGCRPLGVISTVLCNTDVYLVIDIFVRNLLFFIHMGWEGDSSKISSAKLFLVGVGVRNHPTNLRIREKGYGGEKNTRM